MVKKYNITANLEISVTFIEEATDGEKAMDQVRDKINKGFFEAILTGFVTSEGTKVKKAIVFNGVILGKED
jgi:hypothetical protein